MRGKAWISLQINIGNECTIHKYEPVVSRETWENIYLHQKSKEAKFKRIVKNSQRWVGRMIIQESYGHHCSKYQMPAV